MNTLLFGLLAVCGLGASPEGPVALTLAPAAGDDVLDVGIERFDVEARYERDTPMVIRSVASSYVPVHLGRVLQASGFWGAVRMVPDDAVLDVKVSGKLIASSQSELVLQIAASDARGKMWVYRQYRASPCRSSEHARRDPFQSLYHRIANDLSVKLAALTPDERLTIRRSAALQFAEGFVPETFAPHRRVSSYGRLDVVRLPAEDDPLVERIAQVRAREQAFHDAFDELYLRWYEAARDAHRAWTTRARRVTSVVVWQTHELERALARLLRLRAESTAHWRDLLQAMFTP